MLVGEDDTVVVPGDISWAMSLGDALSDFRFIDDLPGKKSSEKEITISGGPRSRRCVPILGKTGSDRSIFLQQRFLEDYVICGSRGSYVERLQFTSDEVDYKKIVLREAARLEISLTEAARLRRKRKIPYPLLLPLPPVSIRLSAVKWSMYFTPSA